MCFASSVWQEMGAVHEAVDVVLTDDQNLRTRPARAQVVVLGRSVTVA